MNDLFDALLSRGWTLAVAEGDTGGVLLAELTAVAGSGAVVRGGVVAYHDDLKRGLLGVDGAVLAERGAVSAEVALAMARGVRSLAGAELGLATTGIAGPGGATPAKPVGLVFVAAVTPGRSATRRHVWVDGDRMANRRQSAEAALALARELLREDEG
jgi:PncC family amidohydrolase